MNAQDAIAWFEQINARRFTKDRHGYYTDAEANDWATEALSALDAVFPQGHAVLKSWKSAVHHSEQHPGTMSSTVVLDAARGVFHSALQQLKAGRLVTLVEGIRAETTNEVLDQAEALLAGKHLVAAAVMAGGALEMHLLHLCNKHQLTWTGDGSISRYDSAVAQARNSGTQIYSVTDSKLVTAWGGIRNDAAHSPGTFVRSPSEMQSMLHGIREFMARNS